MTRTIGEQEATSPLQCTHFCRTIECEVGSGIRERQIRRWVRKRTRSSLGVFFSLIKTPGVGECALAIFYLSPKGDQPTVDERRALSLRHSIWPTHPRAQNNSQGTCGHWHSAHEITTMCVRACVVVHAKCTVQPIKRQLIRKSCLCGLAPFHSVRVFFLRARCDMIAAPCYPPCCPSSSLARQ